MNIKREKPEILRITYRQDRNDPDYGSCLWAFFNFDPENGILSIESDCGHYAHRWPETGEMFLDMCGYFDKNYLLGKLCGKPGHLDLDLTIEAAREYLVDMELEMDEIEELIGSLECRLNENICPSADAAQVILDEWNYDYGIEIDQAWELAEVTYSAQEKRIVDIYRDHVEPVLREMSTERKNKAGVGDA